MGGYIVGRDIGPVYVTTDEIEDVYRRAARYDQFQARAASCLKTPIELGETTRGDRETDHRAADATLLACIKIGLISAAYHHVVPWFTAEEPALPGLAAPGGRE